MESNGGHKEPLHVLDLPQIYTKPSLEALIEALNLLELGPPSWDASDTREPPVQDDPQAIASYLTKIVSSPLKWLDDDGREQVWDLASRRLSERSGRTGMSAITRTWVIPSTANCPEISLKIHEPPLTGDNLGLKTWASSFILAKSLEALSNKHLPNLRNTTTVLELGSGTGLVGLAAAAIWQCNVHLTDLPEIVPNLKYNAEQNATIIADRGGKITADVLDWDATASIPAKDKYQIVLAADPLYSPAHAPMLSRTIAQYLAKEERAHVIIELPLRDKATESMGDSLRQLMAEEQLELLDQGTEEGYDDWEDHGERAVVRCWWGVWRWAATINASDEAES